MTGTSIVWFRDDLRVHDNPALSAAIERGGAVVALYVLDEESAGIRPLGGAARWWLHHSLESLARGLGDLGVQLVLRRGEAQRVVHELVAQTGAEAVLWNRRYSLPERTVDTDLKSRLRAEGTDVASFAASLLHEPWTVTTGTGSHYSVFTPFWRACLSRPTPRLPLPAPLEAAAETASVPSDDLADWRLLPRAPDWSRGLAEAWEPGEPAARRQLLEFVRGGLADYDRARDEPGLEGTSRLSPRLRWGELSPFTVWHEAVAADGGGRFLTELGWREFAWHTLDRFPDLATKNLRAEFDSFPWPQPDEYALGAWRSGQTGVPLVDAGMRELWTTGHMHNRVRMVVASFLVKNLLIDWRVGEEWFWDTLVDADAASNPFNWQWVAGSGADAAPYFRVFNPMLQAEKFDPHRTYIDRWAPDSTGEPIVDLQATRRAALRAYDEIKRAR
ncbi:Deoxyribodipyrimidine photo-lyase [Microbacterium hydrocarbonoxydans]|uniref:Deoxyribodipyrimidine photo-lyase n=1 Tax=Microbacterium hydrocarbonoxydans TaxID=273678 RepID=A0A0M2HMV4_9MICO|nr:deoxyribodipyrimidine photo-lyase [Microbacterium hydrocarbonoxydans]KJL48092.1 Deoxyribodipyrimidine photo-lyase [Microbacterium hydrocarbonoxydans]